MNTRPATQPQPDDAPDGRLADALLGSAGAPGTTQAGTYRRAFQAAPQPMAIVDPQGRALALNDAFVQELGYSLAEVPTIADYVKLVFADQEYGRQVIQRWETAGREFLRSGTPQDPIVADIHRRDGALRTFEVRSTWTQTETFVTFLDVTERSAAEERMRLWNSIMRSTAEGVMVCDQHNRIVAVNPAFERITGFGEAEVIGQTPKILHSGRQDPDFYATMWNNLLTTGQWSGEIWNRRKSGEVYAEWLTLNAVKDADGRTTHYVGVFSDITEHKRQEQHLRHLALFDALTSLPNRTHLLQRLEHALTIGMRQKSRLAVLFVDLDRFKEINDSMGHDAGDVLLRTVAGRLRSVVRDADTVSRMGGDEFVLLLEDLRNGDDAARVAEELLREIARPVMLDGEEVAVSASIGIGLYPEDGTSAGELMRNADTAMYEAKRNGRNGYVFYTRAMNEHATVRLRLENDLRQAVERDELVLRFQPQIDLESGAIVGAEALARWNRPGHGLVSPADFIPIAEESGSIGTIGAWVFEEALRQVRIWDALRLPAITIAVNVSPSNPQTGFRQTHRTGHRRARYRRPARRTGDHRGRRDGRRGILAAHTGRAPRSGREAVDR